MHTSTMLCAKDFTYSCSAASSPSTISLATFCPHYHPLDRVGIAAPYMEEALRHTGYALLALTTAFYDALRSQLTDFFDYPHHFALLDMTSAGVQGRAGRIAFSRSVTGSPWGGLDVWPESNWVEALGTPTGMLSAAFERQITRLFWPYGFFPAAGSAAVRLPGYVFKLLHARLHTVYYYDSPSPNVAVAVTPIVEEIVQKSLARLPDDLAVSPTLLPTSSTDRAFPYIAHYEQVSGAAFLATMSACFEKTA